MQTITVEQRASQCKPCSKLLAATTADSQLETSMQNFTKNSGMLAFTAASGHREYFRTAILGLTLLPLTLHTHANVLLSSTIIPGLSCSQQPSTGGPAQHSRPLLSDAYMQPNTICQAARIVHKSEALTPNLSPDLAHRMCCASPHKAQIKSTASTIFEGITRGRVGFRDFFGMEKRF